MTKKIMLTVPEDLYSRIEEASRESMRPIATEALYRVKLGLDGVLLSGASEDKRSVEGSKIDSGDRVKVKEGVPVEKEVRLDKLVKSGVVKRGVKELPSQDVGGLKTYFKG